MKTAEYESLQQRLTGAIDGLQADMAAAQQVEAALRATAAEQEARLTAAHLIAAAAKFNITLHEEDAADMIDMFSGPPPGEMGFEDFTRTARQASRGALTR